ncbi:polysaccharide lyase family protein [Mariniflexile sp. HNIBRBA6329]|uniref:polysaccharide lyase family protein n=1 Tax=Mariniflexile sp. HNIBRBA6329 TaxID=3373088 RepID=UPI003744BF3A
MKKIIYTLCLIISGHTLGAQANVSASVDTGNRTASMNNGIVSVAINSNGQVTSLIYNGKNLVANGGKFYFSYNDQSAYSELSPNSVRLEKQNDDYAEVVYSKTSGTLLVEQGYVIKKGESGIYSYVVVKGTPTEIRLREMRLVYRVDPNLFNYGYVTESMQGELPTAAVMKAVDGSPIMDATYQLPDGSVYTKYNWANYIDRDNVHGIMSNNEGVWAIAASNEYTNGGPMKQELTVHATNKTPLVLQMLQGEHFGAASQYYSTGVDKIYGPFFIYVNSGNTHSEMVADAKQQAALQKAQWPYQWFTNPLFPVDRTAVSGQINIPNGLSPDKLQVVLAKPGVSLYNQGTDYMFWSKTDANGQFTIPHVRPGQYSLYAYATEGEITDTFTLDNITVSGSDMNLGTIDWTPAKYENLLWRIGENDRLTEGFNMSDLPRAYGLYDLPPANLTYNIGTSIPETDWYYAQTKTGMWTVAFNNSTPLSGNATLTVSIAGATGNPNVEVYVNDVKTTTWSFGNDASVYRSAVLGGRHEVKKLTFPASNLVIGNNTIKFKMTSVGNRGGLMYDTLKLETGSALLSTENDTPQFGTSVKCYPNPIKNSATFTFNTSLSENLVLSIYNLNGQLMDVVYTGAIKTGLNTIEWNHITLPSGLYIYQLKTDSGSYNGKLIKL